MPANFEQKLTKTSLLCEDIIKRKEKKPGRRVMKMIDILSLVRKL